MRRAPPLTTVPALWAGGLCAAAQFAKVGLTLPELAALYPEADAALGFLVSSISVVGVLLGLIAGMIAPRVGLRRLLLGGLALGAAVSLVQSILPPLPLLLASRLLEGLSHLAVVVAAPTLVARASAARWRPAAMTLWGTFFGVAFALTAWLGLPLVESRGPGALFAAHGVVTAVVAAVLAATLPSDSERAVRTAGAEGVERAARGGRVGRADRAAPTGTAPFSPRGLLERHLRAWRSPFVAAPAAGWLFYTITFVALLAVLPGLVAPSERAFVAAAMPLASIASSLTIGVTLLRRVGAVRTVVLGFALATLIVVTLPFAPGEPWPCIALFAALGLVQGASFAAIPELNADAADQALANGALAQSGNLGNACGTPLLLAALATGGLGATVALVALCYVAAIAVHLRLAARRRATTPRARRESGARDRSSGPSRRERP